MKRVAVVHAPSLAGGPLRLLNRLLQALGEARARSPDGEPWSAVLCIDPVRSRSRDRALFLLNEAGDPVTLHGPEGGVLDEDTRASLLAALTDTLPPTAEARTIGERLLPAAGSEPSDASRMLWESLLGPSGLEVVGFHADQPEAAAVGEPPWQECERIDEREVTWFGPRHLSFLEEMRVAPAAALRGEHVLRESLSPRDASGVVRDAAALEQKWNEDLGRIEKQVEEEDPRLVGAWMRLRREVRRSARDFRRRVERNTRNRSGIRGSRLHRLAQGLRPLDGPQEDRIGLVTAAASFGLDLDGLAAHIEAFARPPRTGRLLLATRPGQPVPDEIGSSPE
jgi:hypothetical protein